MVKHTILLGKEQCVKQGIVSNSTKHEKRSESCEPDAAPLERYIKNAALNLETVQYAAMCKSTS